MIQFDDDYDEKNEDSLYIHHLATDTKYKNIGEYIFNQIKEVAKNNSKKYVKLDHIQSNKKLSDYYENKGFEQIRIIGAKEYDGRNCGIQRCLKID